MKTKPTLIALAALSFCLASYAYAEQSQDELKQRILSQARSVNPEDYSFTRTVRTEVTSGGKTEKKVLVDRFDPTKPAAARWSLLSVDGATPSEDVLKSYRTEAAKRRFVPGYGRLAQYLGAPATASSDARGRTVFHFTVLPADTVRIMDTDVSDKATVDASVSEANGAPYVEQVRTTLRPLRLKLLFKIDRFEQTARYRIGLEGKPFLIEQTSDMSGSGMGKEGQIRTAVTYSDYKAVR